MAPAFSKPVETPTDPAVSTSTSSEPKKRTRVIASKLTDIDNISKDAKKRKLEQVARNPPSSTNPAIQTELNFSTTKTHPKASHGSQRPNTRHSSVEIEEVDDEDLLACRNAGPTINSASIIEAADGSDDDLPISVTTSKGKKRAAGHSVSEAEVEEAAGDEPAAKKKKTETAEEELGQLMI